MFSFLPSPVTSPCLSKHQGRTSISRCSLWTMCTASGSDGFTPWTSWWNTTKRPPSSPASMGRSSTSSERFRDALPVAPATSWPWCHTHFPRAKRMAPRRRGRSRAVQQRVHSVQWLIPYWLPLLVDLSVQVVCFHLPPLRHARSSLHVQGHPAPGQFERRTGGRGASLFTLFLLSWKQP